MKFFNLHTFDDGKGVFKIHLIHLIFNSPNKMSNSEI